MVSRALIPASVGHSVSKEGGHGSVLALRRKNGARLWIHASRRNETFFVSVTGEGRFAQFLGKLVWSVYGGNALIGTP